MTKTRQKPVRPEEIPPPDWNALRTALRTGAPLTAWRAEAVAGPVQAAKCGLNDQPLPGGAGWLHASCRKEEDRILLLVGNGTGRAPGWYSVATVRGAVATWTGLAEPNAVQSLRERLICCLLRDLGLKVVAPYMHVDGGLLDTDRVLVGAVCQRPGCRRPLTTPESIASGYGPVCGGRVKPPRSWAHLTPEYIAERMRALGMLPPT